MIYLDMPFVPLHPRWVGVYLGICLPGVSLRSTPGYLPVSLRDALNPPD